MISQEYANIALQMRDTILTEIARAAASLPPTIPCRVIEKTGSTVTVIPIVGIGVEPKTMYDIPIVKSRYFNEPLQPGDKGMLVPASFLFDVLITGGQDEITDPYPSTNLGGYMFVPLSAQDNDHDGAGDVSAMYSKNGTAWVSVKVNDLIVLKNANYSLLERLQRLVADVNSALSGISVNGSSGTDPQGGSVTINSTSVSHPTVATDFTGLLAAS